jgi:pimeloyl-ACP methyl ester carboxylesterase
VEYLRELVEYWLYSYDWRQQETQLNLIPQFTTTIDGQTIHFLHIRSPHPDALPLLLIHGWPSSVIEFWDLIGPLAGPETDNKPSRLAFHLVIPSLPGFAFSGPTREPGWTVRRIAEAFAELMRCLGYENYGAHGGDWGSVIAPEIGRCASDRVTGIHVSAATIGFTPSGIVEKTVRARLTQSELRRLERIEYFRSEGSAYFLLQATRPQTLAYSLTDSPTGQLAWITEKFQEWSHNPDAIDRDRLLTNVMLYWLTRTAGSSANLYYETMQARPQLSSSGVPTGVAVFAEDVAIRRFAEQSNHIVYWSEFDRGGHFAGLEEPDLLATDIRNFFSQIWR